MSCRHALELLIARAEQEQVFECYFFSKMFNI